MHLVHSILHALTITGDMTWEILWSLLLGFILSATIQAVVRKGTIAKRLGSNDAKSLIAATGFGIASSSCSYASVAIARTLFRKGASFTNAMVFEIASTNLVVELGIIMALLLGWRFTLGEFIGGPIMIILIAIGFRITLRAKLLKTAREQANKAIGGSMEGHAAMDMSIGKQGSLFARLASSDGQTSISHIFVMEVAAVWKDIVGGLLIAGAVAAWVPASFFKFIFFSHHPLAAKLWGPVVGPIISMLSFVCSIGNVPLAAVLWRDGISFGGVLAFIVADLIIFPILLIYRKYYGNKMMLLILGVFYLSMVIAGWLSEVIFNLFGITPTEHHALAISQHPSLNYTTVLNIVLIGLAVWLVIRFVRSGALPMLKMMEGEPPKIN